MEVDTRAAALGAQESHSVQKKLTQVYKVTKSSLLAESKSKAGNARLQQAGVELCPLPALVVVKPEPVEVCQLPTPVVVKPEPVEVCQLPALVVVKPEPVGVCQLPTPVVVKPEPVGVCQLPTPVFVKPEPVEYNGSLIPESTASLLHQESTILAQIPIPGAAPGLQKVKRELLSPSSCVTNATEDVVASDGVESLAAAHANPMCSGCLTPTEPEFIVALTPLPALPDEAAPTTTTLVMTQEPPKHPSTKPKTAEPTENLATQAATLTEMITPSRMLPAKLDPGVGLVESTPASIVSPASECALRPVKSEPLVASPPLQKPSIVKEEVLTSPLERNRSGVFTQSAAAAAVASSESEDDSEEDSEEDIVKGTQTRRSQYVGNSQTDTKLRSSKPGFRIQGGRVYDSEFGITCHWCRQKTVEHHVKCRQCTIHFCGPCLLNRNGENVRQELCEGVRWLCPKCRHGCGPGCDSCCNCGPCRKSLGLSPTGQLIGQARSVGFGNVHDYLVHLETGESATKIARRKRGRGWTNEGRFECESLESSDSDADASSSSDGGDELTLDEVTSSQLHQGLLGMKFVRKFVKSQKRKRVVTQAPLPVKKNRVDVWHNVHNVAARMRGSQSSPKVSLPKVAEPTFVKENEDAVTPACQTVVQNLKTPEQCTDVGDLQIKTCKREHVECNDGTDLETSVKRQKLTLDQQSAASNELLSPFTCKAELISANVHTPGAQGGSSLVSESEVLSKVNRAHAVNNSVSSSPSSTTSEQQRGMECPTDSQGTDFRMKLKAALAQPFDAKELEELDCSVRCRKPVLKLRHMRGRVIDVVTEEDGLSYLDHHQDFATKLEEAQSPPEKLALLRGFIFWLQHSCMEGAFRPWPRALAKSEHQSGDCIETEGPDCQVTAVVLQLDEANEAQPLLNHTLMNPVESPIQTASIPFGSHSSQQRLIPYPAKKVSSLPEKPKMRSQVQPTANYQVVLGLPAMTLGKI